MSAKLHLLCVRYNVNVQILSLLAPAGIANSWQSPIAKFPGEGVAPHLACGRETTLWVEGLHTAVGIAQDWNEKWPGLQITMFDANTQEILAGPIK